MIFNLLSSPYLPNANSPYSLIVARKIVKHSLLSYKLTFALIASYKCLGNQGGNWAAFWRLIAVFTSEETHKCCIYAAWQAAMPISYMLKTECKFTIF